MAEVVIPRDLFADILRRIDRLRPPPAPARAPAPRSFVSPPTGSVRPDRSGSPARNTNPRHQRRHLVLDHPIRREYTAVSCYQTVVEANPALRYDKLDEVLETARPGDLLERMRALRNAVFHVRPSTHAHRLAMDIVKGSAANGLQWNTLEDLLFEATEAAFRNPEALYQEKVEVLEEGFRRALAYYEQHLAEKDE